MSSFTDVFSRQATGLRYPTKTSEKSPEKKISSLMKALNKPAGASVGSTPEKVLVVTKDGKRGRGRPRKQKRNADAMEVDQPKTSEAMDVDPPKDSMKMNQPKKQKVAQTFTIAMTPSKMTMYPSRYDSMEAYVYINAEHVLMKQPNKLPSGEVIKGTIWKKLDRQVSIRGAVSIELQKKLAEAMLSKTRSVLEVHSPEFVNDMPTFKLTKNNQ